MRYKELMTTEEAILEPNGLSERLRHNIVLVTGVPTRLRRVPDQLRKSVRRLMSTAGTRLRASLDIPTGTELHELLQRVEALDCRLSELQAKKT